MLAMFRSDDEHKAEKMLVDRLEADFQLACKSGSVVACSHILFYGLTFVQVRMRT